MPSLAFVSSMPLFVSLPLPWLACEVGWVVAEFGRQPWVVEGELPTFLAASTLPIQDLWISIGGFVFFYSLLAVIELYLMVKYIRLGPEALFKPSEFGLNKADHPPRSYLGYY